MCSNTSFDVWEQWTPWSFKIKMPKMQRLPPWICRLRGIPWAREDLLHKTTLYVTVASWFLCTCQTPSNFWNVCSFHSDCHWGYQPFKYFNNHHMPRNRHSAFESHYSGRLRLYWLRCLPEWEPHFDITAFSLYHCYPQTHCCVERNKETHETHSYSFPACVLNGL